MGQARLGRAIGALFMTSAFLRKGASLGYAGLNQNLKDLKRTCLPRDKQARLRADLRRAEKASFVALEGRGLRVRQAWLAGVRARPSVRF